MGTSQGLQSEQKAGFEIDAEALGQLSIWPKAGGGGTTVDFGFVG